MNSHRKEWNKRYKRRVLDELVDVAELFPRVSCTGGSQPTETALYSLPNDIIWRLDAALKLLHIKPSHFGEMRKRKDYRIHIWREQIVLDLISLGVHKISKKKQKKYVNKLLKKMREDI